MTGAPTTPMETVKSKAQNSTVATASTKRCVASSPSAARVAAKIGTKACENAPSANNLRRRLGIRNATLNASVNALAPKVAAMIWSRINPVTREAKVNTETVDAALRRFIPPAHDPRVRADCS